MCVYEKLWALRDFQIKLLYCYYSVDYVCRITGSFLGVTIYYLAYKCLGIDYDVMLTNVK